MSSSALLLTNEEVAEGAEHTEHVSAGHRLLVEDVAALAVISMVIIGSLVIWLCNI